MSMNPSGLEPIPEETRALMQRLSPKGTMVSQLRDALGPIYSDEGFVHLFPTRGRAAEAPWRLALVTVLQAIEGLTDRQAAEYVRTRIDWLYALALPLSDPGFDYSTRAISSKQGLLRNSWPHVVITINSLHSNSGHKSHSSICCEFLQR